MACSSQLLNLYTDHKGGCISFDSLSDIPILIANVIQILLTLSAILAVIFIIYAGIQYTTSSGDPARTKGAKGALTNAVAGLVLSAGAYLIVSFLANQF